MVTTQSVDNAASMRDHTQVFHFQQNFLTLQVALMNLERRDQNIRLQIRPGSAREGTRLLPTGVHHQRRSSSQFRISVEVERSLQQCATELLLSFSKWSRRATVRSCGENAHTRQEG